MISCINFGSKRNLMGITISGTRGPHDDSVMEKGLKTARQAGFHLPEKIILDDAELFKRGEQKAGHPIYGRSKDDIVYLNPYREVFRPFYSASTKREDHVLLHEITQKLSC